ncbi:hypothetical protein [Streptomyces sp. ALI-76-A]|uniref:hypothetical protein n=1 Tax=Streptomyces sp. ALI-76-A TaxID=3025736 RepID=UPI00256EBA6C|nr:hypothetical protein [Streptomyces sp. ALI-76-A]MDL5199778.1 hypothetical protein [Streptomyces sp. ALI-76-A]
MTLLSRTRLRPTSLSGRSRPDDPALAWEIPVLGDNDPGQEAYMLLGAAWRSSTARLVRTGDGFDAVRVPQSYAAAALEVLRRCGARRGAVPSDSGLWTFFVPPDSGSLPWPTWVTYLSGPTVRIPPRPARSDGLNLRWITRGEPTGQLLTAPFVLCPIFTTLVLPSPDPTLDRA